MIKYGGGTRKVNRRTEEGKQKRIMLQMFHRHMNRREGRKSCGMPNISHLVYRQLSSGVSGGIGI
jgi:hypothetical protein